MLAKEPIDRIENAEPTEPIEANDPTLPIDRNDPELPIDSIELCERMLSTDVFRDISPSWAAVGQPASSAEVHPRA